MIPPPVFPILKPTFSVAVCTYNRATILEGLLHSLAIQTVQRTFFEVIVIDNNSSDQTQAICHDFAISYQNIKVVFEPNQGLSHARNRAILEASGKYVAYIDDDSKAPTQWLATASAIVSSYNPDIFGGPYYPFYISDKPRWWKDSYRTREHAEKARFLKVNEKLSGGNIFFRKKLLETSSGFDPTLGMTGKRIGLGEEDAIIACLHEISPGLKMYYDPALYVYHLVHPNKMTLRWAIRKRFADGRYLEKIRSGHHAKPPIGKSPHPKQRPFSTTILDALVTLFNRDPHVYPFFQNYLYERIFPYITELGIIYERKRLRILRSKKKRL